MLYYIFFSKYLQVFSDKILAFFDNNLYCYNELFVAKNKNNKFLDQPLMLSNQHLNIINTENNNDEFQLKIDGNSYVIKN